MENKFEKKTPKKVELFMNIKGIITVILYLNLKGFQFF